MRQDQAGEGRTAGAVGGARDPGRARMRVFLTGATGHVGEAVAEAFRRGGHDVLALARSAGAADRVAAGGLTPVHGALAEPATYAAAVRASDVVVHAGFDYTPEGEERRDVDRAAVDAFLAQLGAAAAADGRPRQLVYTSNACLLRAVGSRPVDESVDTSNPAIPPAWRFAVERRVLDAAAPAPGGGGVHTAVVRLGVVYGCAGGSGPSLYAAAARHGAGVYRSPVAGGSGTPRLAFVQRDDAAALYLRVAERRAAGVFHAVDGRLLTPAEAAEAVSVAAGFGGRELALDPEAAAAALGEHTADLMARDLAVLPVRSRALGWSPAYASFQDGAAAAFRDWRASRAAT